MKTATEIAKKYFRADLIILEDMETDIRKYAKQKCKEQREICSRVKAEHYVKDSIMNAPEPDFK